MGRRLIQVTSLASVLTVSTLSLAQPPGRGGGRGEMRVGPRPEMILEIFQQADANRDGSVTRAELTSAMQEHANRDRGRRAGSNGGPGQHGPGQHGPPPRPGQVLPAAVVASLGLSAAQTEQLSELQSDVDKRLAQILTVAQRAALQDATPPHEMSPRGKNDQPREGNTRRAGRPQRPE